MLRYEALVDSAAALLEEHSPDDVGIYQIAERAGVPIASVYHFFPTKQAAFLALGQRYLKGFTLIFSQPIDYRALHGWQALLYWNLCKVVDYYHANPPAMKLFLGRYGGLETRKAESEFNAQAARRLYRNLSSIFHMPFIREPEIKFHLHVEITDAILAVSYLKHGTISIEYRDEAHAAAVAYCRLFLPERAELRDEHVEALKQHRSIQIKQASIE